MSRLVRSWPNPSTVDLYLDGTTLIEREKAALTIEHKREFGDPAAAMAGYYARLGEMLRGGWGRSGDLHENPKSVVERPSDATLEASIDGESIDTVTDSRDVYLDWLAARGDPVGELGPLYAALERGDGDRHALLQRISHTEWTHGNAVFGPINSLFPEWRRFVHLRWYRGWVDRIVIRFDHPILDVHGRAAGQSLVVEIIHQALHMPVARFVHWLDLDEFAIHAASGALHTCPAARGLRGLRMDGNGDGLIVRLPGLRQVELTRSFPPLNHETLQSIEANIDDVRGRPRWPALRRLVCHATTRIRSGGILDAVLDGDGVPSLTELEIVAKRGRIDAIVDPLLDGDLLPRLRTLRLAGNLSHTARSRIDAAHAKTAHLEDLSYR